MLIAMFPGAAGRARRSRLLQPVLATLGTLAWLASFAFAEHDAHAQVFETKATQAYLIDAETETVLFAKNADAPIPPASLAKLMTMEIVFAALKSGELTMDRTFVVSEHAWRTGGAPSRTSTMFAALKSEIRVEDLIQGVVVQSANDGCIILAEGMSGSEPAFVERMNARATDLGLAKSAFGNSTGLPAAGQAVTMRELTMLGAHIWRQYPDFYRYYAQPEFTWNKITQRNRNPLLAMGIGADGMGTGFTEESGFAILGSAERNGRRLFAAMGGLTSDKERAEEARKFIDWGFTAFTRRDLFDADDVVGQAQVYGGDRASVPLVARARVSILIPTETDRVSARIVYDGPLAAPVEKGAPVGSLDIYVADLLSQRTPLYAAEAVGVGALHQRALDAIGELLVGWLRVL